LAGPGERGRREAAEKVLKAFLYHRGAVEVWGHSAAELCERCAELEPSFREFASSAALLDKYYIPTRYPTACRAVFPKTLSTK